MSHTDFQDRAAVTLNDVKLTTEFRNAMDFLRNKRSSVIPSRDEFEALAARGRAIREEALDQLPDLLVALEKRCLANGIQVHWAEDSAQACEIVEGIAKDRQARSFIKGKSMASEEIGLNHFLIERGYECLESDMGEYIVQLAGETPSHIIMPAIHKSKVAIAELFAERIEGHRYTENVDELIGAGRAVLREKFEAADIGISGVNFAVAETGTLCLVENEGNGRMSTTVPNTHIAICGIEKVIPRLEDLPTLLSLLTRSATGQKITTYVNLISSPRQPGDLDGPAAVHLILLDNGRSRIHRDPELRETLLCIRCGACMNHCPVYTRIGGHAYGSVYPGPIGQVVAPQLEGLAQHGEIVEACTLNGACGEVCPVGIPLPGLIRRLRERKRHTPDEQADADAVPGSGRGRSWFEAGLWRAWTLAASSPRLYSLIRLFVTRARALIPRRIGSWSSVRTQPKPAPRSLNELMKDRHV
ncbi:LutB/LldF family L-lactate oxidation iron-sulfur protein [Allohahella marinimesophila]|uniref:LutB/LldF family L-lactate oxidation iron-sulfur protein n=1 Tax=Allohahella marinimesophila TaxID=1054972 RepID=A0ABP7NJ42_9GAMM